MITLLLVFPLIWMINALSTGSTVVGPSIVDTESVAIGVGIGTTTIVGIASTYRSAHVMVSINPDINYEEFEYNQFNIIHDGTTVDIMEYGRLSTNITEGYVSRTGMGLIVDILKMIY